MTTTTDKASYTQTAPWAGQPAALASLACLFQMPDGWGATTRTCLEMRTVGRTRISFFVCVRRVWRSLVFGTFFKKKKKSANNMTL